MQILVFGVEKKKGKEREKGRNRKRERQGEKVIKKEGRRAT